MCPTDMQYVRASPYLPIIEERQTDWGEAPPIELIYRASLATNTKKNQQLSRVSVRSVCALQVGFYHPSHHYYHTKRRIQKLHILISVLACVALDKKSAFKSLIKMQCTRPRSFFTAKGANLNRLDHHYYSFHVFIFAMKLWNMTRLLRHFNGNSGMKQIICPHVVFR